MTSLGVFFGLFFFIILLSIGIGLKNGLDQQLNNISSNFVGFDVRPTTLPYQGYKTNRRISFRYSDYEALYNQSKTLENISCISFMSNSDSFYSTIDVKYSTGKINSSVMGISKNYTKLNNLKVSKGRPLSNNDIENNLNVCVVGIDIIKPLFKNPDTALGELIDINGIMFKIVGIITENTGITLGANPTQTIIVPLHYTIYKDPNKQILFCGDLKQGVSLEEANEEVFSYLSRKYTIHPKDKDIVISIGTSTMFGFINMITNGINILVWLIGMGTLVTGIISVSNILIVTVRERQREIGVRRALGAKPKDIFKQFILESIFMISLAGFGGLTLGLLVTLGIGNIIENSAKLSYMIVRPYVPSSIIFISITIILVSGVLAGLLPVYKALEVKAIDAIRDE